MTQTPSQTPYQLLAEFQRVTGEQVRLKRYDSIMALEVTDSTITLLVEWHRFTEMTREDRLTAKGMRMISYGPKGRRVIEVDDEDFVPVVVRHWGSGKTESEWYDQRDWETICYRPGDGSRFGQRDSAQVQADLAEDRLNARLFATSTTTSLPTREA